MRRAQSRRSTPIWTRMPNRSTRTRTGRQRGRADRIVRLAAPCRCVPVNSDVVPPDRKRKRRACAGRGSLRTVAPTEVILAQGSIAPHSKKSRQTGHATRTFSQSSVDYVNISVQQVLIDTDILSASFARLLCAGHFQFCQGFTRTARSCRQHSRNAKANTWPSSTTTPKSTAVRLLNRTSSDTSVSRPRRCTR